MHSILVATQEDAVISSDIARQSKDLAEEMKRDSVAMKTVGGMQSKTFLYFHESNPRVIDRSHHHGFSAWHFVRGLNLTTPFPISISISLIFTPQAFLAMPFFATNHYLGNAAKVWIWAVCTVISTVIAFTFYFYWKRREDQAKKISLDADGNEWHGMNG